MNNWLLGSVVMFGVFRFFRFRLWSVGRCLVRCWCIFLRVCG